jgi:hypothetical protein
MNATTTPNTPAAASDYFPAADIIPARDLSLLRPLIAATKDEITADIAAGLVPETVGSFGELHDYVDANTYAQDGALDPDGGYAEWNYITDVLDRWLTVGRPDARAQFALNRMAAQGWEPVGLNGYVWVTLPAAPGDPRPTLSGVRSERAATERKSPGLPWRRYSMPLSLVADFWAAWVSA